MRLCFGPKPKNLLQSETKQISPKKKNIYIYIFMFPFWWWLPRSGNKLGSTETGKSRATHLLPENVAAALSAADSRTHGGRRNLQALHPHPRLPLCAFISGTNHIHTYLWSFSWGYCFFVKVCRYCGMGLFRNRLCANVVWASASAFMDFLDIWHCNFKDLVSGTEHPLRPWLIGAHVPRLWCTGFASV